MRKSIILSAVVLSAIVPAGARAQTDVFLCADENGKSEYKNTGAVKGCQRIDLSEVASENWVFLGKSGTAAIFIDPSTSVDTGKYRKAWFLFNQIGANPGTPTRAQYGSETEMDYFSCGARTMFTAQTIKYALGDSKGEVIDSRTWKVMDDAFADVAPNTAGAQMLAAVCKTAQPKQTIAHGNRSSHGTNSNGTARLSPAELKARANGKVPHELTPEQIKAVGY